MQELDELYERRRELEERRDSFFGEDEIVEYGDQGYQDILQSLDAVNEEIEIIIGRDK